MNGNVAVGLLKWLFEAAQRSYGIPQKQLLEAALLEPEDFDDPSLLVPMDALIDAFRFLIERTGDAGVGLALAGPVELRTQGFWGYALLSSLTLRQRMELHLRFQRLRSPLALSFWEEESKAIASVELSGIPPDVAPVLLDWGFAVALHQLRRHLGQRILGIEVWLSYEERPHHTRLRALAGGPIVFAAPCNRLHFPSSLLDTRLDGDRNLGKLAGAQLDAQLRAVEAQHGAAAHSLLEAVRARIAARLERDASLPRIASELRMSARTLQRQLDRLGASFQQLLEDVRRTRAIEYLLRSDAGVERIAIQLGYGDPANFRRAFRRWTGVAPSAFRAEHRSRPSGLPTRP